MLNELVSICHYPTKVVLLDDNPDFLYVLGDGLKQAGIDFVAYTNPEEALERINSQASGSSSRFDKALKKPNSYNTYASEADLPIFDLDIFLAELDDGDRYNDVSVVVVDYEMPTIKGDEFLGLVNNKHVKKLLLTGHKKQELAIQLLNEHKIDCFIEKKPINGLVEIQNKVKELQVEYFIDATQKITNSVFSDEAIIYSDAYKQIIEDILSSQDIIEHHIASYKGSRIFKKLDGTYVLLILADEMDFSGWLQTAMLADAPDEVIAALENHSHLLNFKNQEDLELAPSQWKQLLCPAKKLPSHHGSYYYALTNCC